MDSTSSAHQNKATLLLTGLAREIVEQASLLESASIVLTNNATASPEKSTTPNRQQACRAMIRCALVMQETLAIIQK